MNYESESKFAKFANNLCNCGWIISELPYSCVWRNLPSISLPTNKILDIRVILENSAP